MSEEDKIAGYYIDSTHPDGRTNYVNTDDYNEAVRLAEALRQDLAERLVNEYTFRIHRTYNIGTRCDNTIIRHEPRKLKGIKTVNYTREGSREGWQEE